MGLISVLLEAVFGSGRNALRETAEVFRENAEAGAQRGHAVQMAALEQLGAELSAPKRGGFDRFIDGVNRLPRPLLALGTLGLMGAAMADPVWFAARMQGLALVPEPLWWLLGVIVSFYFGARHQAKTQEYRQSLAATLAHAPEVARNVAALDALRQPAAAGQAALAAGEDENPALEDWRAARG